MALSKKIQKALDANLVNLENINDAVDSINSKLNYLHGDKFQGVDNNYVNAREMSSFLLELRMVLRR